MNQPQDYLARQAALDATRSFAVSAPAGSGKTGLLTQRVLKLLSISQYPEEVLAITFTRKAAGEMQDRLLKALWNARENPEPENPHEKNTWLLAQAVLKQDQDNHWNLLECPQRLRVQTIDSLCSLISKQLPLANGFGSTPAPTDNPENAYREAIARLLKRIDSDSPLKDDLIRLLSHLDNNLPQLETLLMTLVAKRDQWLAAIFQASFAHAQTYLEAVLQDVINEHLKAVASVLQDQSSELALIADWAGTNIAASDDTNAFAQFSGLVGLPKPIYTELAQWKLIANFLLTNSGTFRKKLTQKEGFPAAKDNKASSGYKDRFAAVVGCLQEQHPHGEQLVAGILGLPTPHYPSNQWALLESLTRILPQLAAELQLVFAEQGEADFTAISQAALVALGDENSPSDAALQLDYRIQHILVDEFQDTSSTQLQLLEKLTAGWQTDDGRTLFIVGDGMQSCYAFRSANVGIFLEARAKGIGHIHLTPLDLTVNFRSQSGIVNWVNEQFVGAFPSENDIGRGAVVYTPSQAFKPALSGAAVHVCISPYVNDKEGNSHSGDPQSLYFAEEIENQSIAALIKKLRDEKPDESVALLARSRNHLQSLFPALARVGLKWQATDIDSLTSRMAIMDLTSLTRALLNPADRIAWLSLLRAPWCGLDLHDLHAVANADLGEKSPRLTETGFPILWQQLLAYEHLDALSEFGKTTLAFFVPLLQKVLAERQRKNLRTWVEGTWLALGGPSTLLDKNDLYDVPKFFNLLEQFEKGGSIQDWNGFNESLSRLYASPRQDADAGLQVMTMHKSKGLEFDHVIMPRLHKRPPQQDQELIMWRERIAQSGERQLLISPLAPIGGDKDPIYHYMKQETALQLEYEATRLFYVGCTRAVKQLYLYACLEKDINEEAPEAINYKEPNNKSLLGSIWKTVKDHRIQISALEGSLNNNIFQGDDQALAHLVRVKRTNSVPVFCDNQLLEKYRGRDYDNEDDLPTPETASARLARHTGTLIHQCFQEYSQTISMANHQTWFDSRTRFWLLKLNAWGFTAEEKSIAIEKIRSALEHTLSDEKGRWILQYRPHAKNELVLTHRQGAGDYQTLKTSIIDRTFFENGVRWVIDYKSSQPEHGQALDTFIEQEVAQYTRQLNRYQRCFAEMGETEIRTVLYFPLVPENKFVLVDC